MGTERQMAACRAQRSQLGHPVTHCNSSSPFSTKGRGKDLHHLLCPCWGSCPSSPTLQVPGGSSAAIDSFHSGRNPAQAFVCERQTKAESPHMTACQEFWLQRGFAVGIYTHEVRSLWSAGGAPLYCPVAISSIPSGTTSPFQYFLDWSAPVSSASRFPLIKLMEPC